MKSLLTCSCFVLLLGTPVAGIPLSRMHQPIELFRMVVEDVYSIAGVGVMSMGTIDSGVVRMNDKLLLTGNGDKIFTVLVSMIGKNGKRVDSAKAGDKVDINLRGITKEEVRRKIILTGISPE